MKVGDLIARSMRLIAVIDPNQAPKPNDFDTGVQALNALMRRMENNQIPMGWSDVSNPGQDLPIPDEYHDGVGYLLALQIAPEYSVMPSPMVRETAQTCLTEMRRDAYTRRDNSQNTNDPRYGRWNIYTDSPGSGVIW